jgi:DUF1680 family protein
MQKFVFLTISIFAVTVLSAQNKYPAASDLYGGAMGIERVAGKSFPLVFQPYASEAKTSADQITWFQVDLGNPKDIEEVKLYPVTRDGWNRYWRSNFPLRFRIEADNDPAFTHPLLIADHTHEDLIETAVLEKVEKFFPQTPVKGRYVRLTVTKLNTTDEKNYLFELWRFEVISGGKDVAQGRTLTDSDRGYMGKHTLLRPQRPMGEGVVINCPENVTSPDSWKPVKTGLSVPRNGVTLGNGPFKDVMERNAHYLMASFTLDDLLKDFRTRAGKPAPGDMMGLNNPWVTQLPGSNAGRFLMGAGNHLRWTEDKEMRNRLNDIVNGIEECREPDGYYIMAYPENKIFFFENGGYCRSWVTQGLIEASFAGNQKALPMLRTYYDWFDECPYLPEMVRRGGYGRQGVIASTRLFNTPVGKPKDLQVVQQHYQENFWMEQLTNRDVDAIWRYPYDRPHCYLIPTLESYADLYMATGESRYLDAAMGGWDLYKEYFQHIGGSISICELADFPPKSNLVHNRTGELCGNVFWIFLNQRLHLIFPEKEQYINELEKSIYNVILPDQNPDGGIRYHTHLANHKEEGRVTNTCCEGQGTRIFSALPEFIYTKAEDGIYVDLFYPSAITWEQAGKTLKMEMTTQFPANTNVKQKVSLKGKTKSNIRIRVPSWATRDMDIAVNGKKIATSAPGTYISINREWSDKDLISFELPAGFRITKYEGVEKPYSLKESHTFALEYGPVLMAITGKSLAEGKAILPFPASQLISKIQPDEKNPLHFKITGMNDETLRYVPYYGIDKEEMTCLVFFSED